MDCDQFISSRQVIADALVEFQPDAMVNGIFLLFAAATQHGQRDAELQAIRVADVSGLWAYDLRAISRQGKQGSIFNNARVAPLQLDSLAEFLQGLPAGDHLLRKSPPFIDGGRAFAEIKHPCGELQAKLAQIVRAISL